MTSIDNDDSDDDMPMFLKPMVFTVVEEDTVPVNRITIINHLEEFILSRGKDVNVIHQQYNDSNDDKLNEREVQYLKVIDNIVIGNYIEVILNSIIDLSPRVLLKTLLNNDTTSTSNSDFIDGTDSISILVVEYINKTSDKLECFYRSFECLLLGIAYLELYCQQNYTGPEVADSIIDNITIIDNDNTTKLHNRCIHLLECDGEYVFNICQIPQALILARVILATLFSPHKANWRHGIMIDSNGSISRKMSSNRPNTNVIDSCKLLKSCSWWSARSTVVHSRTMQSRHYDKLPTLWKECQESFAVSLETYGEYKKHHQHHLKNIHIIIEAIIWMEWGLCNHYFDYKDKGKGHFARAQAAIELSTLLTSAMGKRTKYQQTAHAQLFLLAKSTLIEREKLAIVSRECPDLELIPRVDAEALTTEGGWKHAEWEVGRRLVGEVNGGEEAAIREVMLDSMDGGPEENILLEGGPKFIDDVDKGGDLHPIDQALILLLCLDVSNENPEDGLTREEMSPYVERVLMKAQNWMIYSTGLLERSWLEYEKRRTMDRAMLQIQALLDQHTTKLTISQSTKKSIEESAPVQDRIEYLYCLVYPSQYELKVDLAFRYLRCQVFVSALNLFKELELWDEVVKCYQLLEKPHRAEVSTIIIIIITIIIIIIRLLSENN